MFPNNPPDFVIPRFEWREIRDLVPGPDGTWVRFTSGTGALCPARAPGHEHQLNRLRGLHASSYPALLRFAPDGTIADVALTELTHVFSSSNLRGEVFDLVVPTRGPGGLVGVRRGAPPLLAVNLMWHQRSYWVPGHHPFAGAIGRALRVASDEKRPVFAAVDYDTVLVLNLMLAPDRILKAIEAASAKATPEQRRAASVAWARAQLDDFGRPHVNRPGGGDG